MQEKLIKSIFNGDIISLKKISYDLDNFFLPHLIHTRLSGYIANFFHAQEIEEYNSTIQNLVILHRLNYLRNINILNTIIELDNYLHKNNIERCWLKGVKDLFLDPSSLFYRKMADTDIIVSSPNLVRELFIEKNFVNGGYTYDGEWISRNNEDINELEKNHYELYPLSRIFNMKAPDFNQDIPQHYLNKFRIFKNNENNYFFSDLTIDVHKELNYDVPANWLKTNNLPLPFMKDIDELWYLIYKSYHEVILGDSRDFQLLISTVNKIRTYNLDKQEVINRISGTNFLNKEAINLLFSIAKEGINKEVTVILVKKFNDYLKKE